MPHPSRTAAASLAAAAVAAGLCLAASSLAEGVTVDAQGNLYGADFLMDVRKFVRK